MWQFSQALKHAVRMWATLPCLPYYYNIIVVKNKTNSPFKLLYQTTDCGFFQFLSHFKLLPKLSSNCNRITCLVESFESMKILLHSLHHAACCTLYSSAHFWNSYIQWYHLVYFPLIMPSGTYFNFLCVFLNFPCISSSSYFSSLCLLSTSSSDPLHLHFSHNVR